MLKFRFNRMATKDIYGSASSLNSNSSLVIYTDDEDPSNPPEDILPESDPPDANQESSIVSPATKNNSRNQRMPVNKKPFLLRHMETRANNKNTPVHPQILQEKPQNIKNTEAKDVIPKMPQEMQKNIKNALKKKIAFTEKAPNVQQKEKSVSTKISSNSNIQIPTNLKAQDLKEILENLQEGKNLEKMLESHGLQKGVDLNSLKKHLQLVVTDAEETIKAVHKDIVPKWQNQVEKLKELNRDKNLEQWLEGLDIPHNVSAPAVKAKLKKYFMHETFETFQGRSLVYQEESVAKKLWDDFREMNPAMQAAVVVGITAVTAVVGFLSWELVILAFPSILAANPFFTEVGAQIFIQRQEGAFHLLLDQSERVKPLSTAWANQYVLWKYL